MTALRAIIRRDLLLAWRRRSDIATTVLFFVIVVSLFPLAVGPEPNLLSVIAPGIIWVAALLACMLSLTRAFEPDHADGALDQMLLAATPLALIVIARVFAHWLVSGLPLVALSPLLALQFDLPADLLPLLTLPLYVPVLVIGAGALDAAAAGQGATAHFLLLAALLVLAGAFTPWAISAALRISAE
jgi:heme exporter protein B